MYDGRDPDMYDAENLLINEKIHEWKTLNCTERGERAWNDHKALDFTSYWLKYPTRLLCLENEENYWKMCRKSEKHIFYDYEKTSRILL